MKKTKKNAGIRNIKLEINGDTIIVKVASDAVLGGDMGRFDSMTMTILINRKLTGKQRLDIFYHELAEYYNWKYTLGFDNDHTKIDIIGCAFKDLMESKIRLKFY